MTHCQGCDGWCGVHMSSPEKCTTTLTPCPGVEACGHETEMNMLIEGLARSDAERDALQAKLDAVVGVLRIIRDDPHQQYDNPETGEGQYGIGVVDGHRCAANKARTALDAASKAIEMRGEAAASDQPCEHNWFHDTCQRCSATRAIPPAPAPMAWKKSSAYKADGYRCDKCSVLRHTARYGVHKDRIGQTCEGGTFIPLYAAPPAPAPMAQGEAGGRCDGGETTGRAAGLVPRMTTLRDAVKEALDEAEVGARAATSLWHQIAPNHDSGGFIDCINPFCGADIMVRFKKLRAALAQEEAGPSREALMELFEAVRDYAKAHEGNWPVSVLSFDDALARCEREAEEGRWTITR